MLEAVGLFNALDELKVLIVWKQSYEKLTNSFLHGFKRPFVNSNPANFFAWLHSDNHNFLFRTSPTLKICCDWSKSSGYTVGVQRRRFRQRSSRCRRSEIGEQWVATLSGENIIRDGSEKLGRSFPLRHRFFALFWHLNVPWRDAKPTLGKNRNPWSKWTQKWSSLVYIKRVTTILPMDASIKPQQLKSTSLRYSHNNN